MLILCSVFLCFIDCISQFWLLHLYFFFLFVVLSEFIHSSPDLWASLLQLEHFYQINCLSLFCFSVLFFFCSFILSFWASSSVSFVWLFVSVKAMEQLLLLVLMEWPCAGTSSLWTTCAWWLWLTVWGCSSCVLAVQKHCTPGLP